MTGKTPCEKYLEEITNPDLEQITLFLEDNESYEKGYSRDSIYNYICTNKFENPTPGEKPIRSGYVVAKERGKERDVFNELYKAFKEEDENKTNFKKLVMEYFEAPEVEKPIPKTRTFSGMNLGGTKPTPSSGSIGSFKFRKSSEQIVKELEGIKKQTTPTSTPSTMKIPLNITKPETESVESRKSKTPTTTPTATPKKSRGTLSVRESKSLVILNDNGYMKYAILKDSQISKYKGALKENPSPKDLEILEKEVDFKNAAGILEDSFKKIYFINKEEEESEEEEEEEEEGEDEDFDESELSEEE